MFFNKISQKNNSQSGGTLLSVLAFVGMAGVSFNIANRNITNSNNAQRVVLISNTHADLEQGINSICRSLYSLKTREASNPRLSDCLHEDRARCVQIVDPNPLRSTHAGLPVEMYSVDATRRYVGKSGCPAYYNEYGAILSKGADLTECNASNMDKPAFAVEASISAHCAGNRRDCSVASNINVKCTIERLSNVASSQFFKTTSSQLIVGYSCPDGQAVNGARDGRFICKSLVSVIGYRGSQGAQGASLDGPAGPAGAHYSVIRSHGCFAKGTMIKVKDGEKKIENIKSNDLVWNPVVGKYFNVRRMAIGPEKEPMYLIKIENKELLVTKYHPMDTKNGIKFAFQISEKDILNTSDGFKKITSISKKSLDKEPNVYNIELYSDENFENHHVVANGIITGDLFIQKSMINRLKDDSLNFEKNLSLNRK